MMMPERATSEPPGITVACGSGRWANVAAPQREAVAASMLS